MDWKVLSLHRTLALHGREHVTEETDDCACNDQPMIRNDCGRVCNVTLGSLETGNNHPFWVITPTHRLNSVKETEPPPRAP